LAARVEQVTRERSRGVIQGARLDRHERAHTGNGGCQPKGAQAFADLRGGRQRDAVLGGQLPGGGQGVTVFEAAGRDVLALLLNELHVRRLAHDLH
jgi:hypothetical protein